MAKLAVGEKMLDFTATGAFGPEEALSSRVGKGKQSYFSDTMDVHCVSMISILMQNITRRL